MRLMKKCPIQEVQKPEIAPGPHAKDMGLK